MPTALVAPGQSQDGSCQKSILALPQTKDFMFPTAGGPPLNIRSIAITAIAAQGGCGGLT